MLSINFNSNYELQELNKNNIEDYVRVKALSWKETYSGFIDEDFLNLINTDEKINETINLEIDKINVNNSKSFLLYVDGNPCGVVRVKRYQNDKYLDCGELAALYLLKKIKGKGYGRILFEKAKEELRKMGYTKMINGCLDKNPSNEFYKHMGGKFIESHPYTLPNSQVVTENLYYYENI